MDPFKKEVSLRYTESLRYCNRRLEARKRASRSLTWKYEETFWVRTGLLCSRIDIAQCPYRCREEIRISKIENGSSREKC